MNRKYDILELCYTKTLSQRKEATKNQSSIKTTKQTARLF